MTADELKEPDTPRLRQFGWLMAGVFLVIALWPLVWRAEGVRIWALAISGLFGGMGVLFPAALAPVFKLWMKFGEKIGWINSRILLSIVFYLILTPIGWVMTLLGKRPLQLGFDSQADTYRVLKTARASDHVTKPF